MSPFISNIWNPHELQSTSKSAETGIRYRSKMFSERFDEIKCVGVSAVLSLAPDGEPQILVVDRVECKNKVHLPGGRVERGESPPEAALRELHEETGFPMKELFPSGYFANNFGTYVGKDKVIFSTLLALFTFTPDINFFIKFDEKEKVSNPRWIKLSDFLESIYYSDSSYYWPLVDFMRQPGILETFDQFLKKLLQKLRKDIHTCPKEQKGQYFKLIDHLTQYTQTSEVITQEG